MKSFFFCVFLMTCFSVQAEGFEHNSWDDLLKKHVSPTNKGSSTQVNYDGFLKDRFHLKVYLSRLEAVSKSTFENWSKKEQLAFLINAYNAWTVELIDQGVGFLDKLAMEKKFHSFVGRGSFT